MTSLDLLLLIWFFSNSILWILGKNYYGLNQELTLLAAINCAGLMGGTCSQLNLSRGWFLKPYFLIGLNFFSTIIGFAFFNIHTLVGILHFTLALTFLVYIMDFVYRYIYVIKKLSFDSGLKS